MGFLKRRRLLRDGLQATGVITALEDRAMHADGEQGSWSPMTLTLDVEGDGRPVREVVLKAKVKRGRMIGHGTTLVLRADPDDPTEVAIDWDATDAMHARGEGLLPGLDGTDYAKTLGILSSGTRNREDVESFKRAAKELAEGRDSEGHDGD